MDIREFAFPLASRGSRHRRSGPCLDPQWRVKILKAWKNVSINHAMATRVTSEGWANPPHYDWNLEYVSASSNYTKYVLLLSSIWNQPYQNTHDDDYSWGSQLHQPPLEDWLHREVERLQRVYEFVRTLLKELLEALFSKVEFAGFAVFPGRIRPPCTTMPWTIWPALVVLWGVCWMFYDHTVEPPNPFEVAFQSASRDLPSDWLGFDNEPQGLPLLNGIWPPAVAFAYEPNCGLAPPGTYTMAPFPIYETHDSLAGEFEISARIAEATSDPQGFQMAFRGDNGAGAFDHLPPPKLDSTEYSRLTSASHSAHSGADPTDETFDRSSGSSEDAPLPTTENYIEEPDSQNRKKRWYCTLSGCGRSYTRQSDLERHMRSKHGQKTIFCPHDGCRHASGGTGGFTRQDHLNQHLENMHTQKTAPVFELPAEKDVDTGSEQAAEESDKQVASNGRIESRKRPRLAESVRPCVTEDEDLMGENRRLRQKVEEQDRKIQRLERIVDRLLDEQTREK